MALILGCNGTHSLDATYVINAISLTVLFRVDRVGGSLQLLRLR